MGAWVELLPDLLPKDPPVTLTVSLFSIMQKFSLSASPRLEVLLACGSKGRGSWLRPMSRWAVVSPSGA